MKPDFESRLGRVRSLAREAGVAGLYVTAGANFRWLTGELAHPGGWPIWLSAVAVPVDGDPAMVVSKMHAEIFDLESSPIPRVFTYVDGEDPTAALAGAFAATGLAGERVGVESSLWFGDSQLLGRAVPSVGLALVQGAFDRLRAVKDTFELEQLRRAAEAHDAGYRRATDAIAAGVTVAEAGAEIIRAMAEAGSEELAIAGSFKSLSPRRFERGDIVDVDLFPGSYGGYRADTARNVFVGEPSEGAKRLYAATLAAYDATVAATRAGVTAESVHRACVEAMGDAGYEQVWKVGHGVGLGEAHEPPLLQTGNTTLLEPGMVVTIDPGAFIARDTPIHIEDTVVVTETGCRPLNRFPRELLVV